jgi:hypothetical protein
LFFPASDAHTNLLQPQPDVLEDLKRKAETISSVVMAEYRHLHESLVEDMNHGMSEFIAQQTYYHSRVRLGPCKTRPRALAGSNPLSFHPCSTQASELWNELAAEYPGYPAEYPAE